MKTQTLAAAVALLSACGGGIPQEQFQGEEIKAICHAYTSCGAFTSEAACNTWFQNLLGMPNVTNPYDSRVKSGKVLYDPSRAKACVDEVGKISCGASLFTPLPNCQLVYQGTVKLGEVCTNTVECTSDAYCALGSTPCSGVCAQRIALGATLPSGGQCVTGLVPVDGKCQMPLGAGAACMSSSFNCDGTQGLYCGSAMVCQKYRLETETCDSMQQCGGLLTCAAGHCSRLLPTGASCASVSGVTPSCQIDLHCDSNTKVCGPLGGAGASCNFDSDCMSPLKCGGTLGSEKCTTPASVNQSCLTTPCDDATYCDTNTRLCKQRIASGQSCTQFDSCVSPNYCQSGTCSSSSCL